MTRPRGQVAPSRPGRGSPGTCSRSRSAGAGWPSSTARTTCGSTAGRAQDPRPGAGRRRAFRQRFIRESRAAAAVDHPNIIPVFDAGEADGVLFIAMRYVSGPDVRTRCSTAQGRCRAGRAVAIVSQVAAGAGRGARAGPGAPRRQAGEHAARPGPGRRPPDHVYLSDFGLSKQAAGGPGPDRDRPVRRHARLRGPGADRGPAGRWPGRPVLAGLHRVRDALRRPAVPPRPAPGPAVGAAVRAAAAAHRPASRPPARGGPGHGESAGQVTRRPLPAVPGLRGSAAGCLPARPRHQRFSNGQPGRGRPGRRRPPGGRPRPPCPGGRGGYGADSRRRLRRGPRRAAHRSRRLRLGPARVSAVRPAYGPAVPRGPGHGSLLLPGPADRAPVRGRPAVRSRPAAVRHWSPGGDRPSFTHRAAAGRRRSSRGP